MDVIHVLWLAGCIPLLDQVAAATRSKHVRAGDAASIEYPDPENQRSKPQRRLTTGRRPRGEHIAAEVTWYTSCRDGLRR